MRIKRLTVNLTVLKIIAFRHLKLQLLQSYFIKKLKQL